MEFKIGTPLDEFIIMKEKDFPYATGDLSKLLRDIGLAAKFINRSVNQAGLVDILGSADNTNVQGEEQQKLDVMADVQLINILKNGGQCAAIASEENDDFIPITSELARNAKYVVCFDPLDGSSNIDVNVSIGTIFSIFRRVTEDGPATQEDLLQKGNRQVAAGYVVYGSSTMLVYTTGFGVHGFTLDPSIGEFCLSHQNMMIPEDGNIYSLNQGNYNKLKESTKNYIDYCNAVDKKTNRPYSLRYIGSMVADLHRTLIKGGIFVYPATDSAPEGKLRLMYECNPMAMLVEQAGGAASSGKKRILDIQPSELHQRTPIYIGSKNMVEKAISFLE